MVYRIFPGSLQSSRRIVERVLILTVALLTALSCGNLVGVGELSSSTKTPNDGEHAGGTANSTSGGTGDGNRGGSSVRRSTEKTTGGITGRGTEGTPVTQLSEGGTGPSSNDTTLTVVDAPRGESGSTSQGGTSPNESLIGGSSTGGSSTGGSSTGGSSTGGSRTDSSGTGGSIFGSTSTSEAIPNPPFCEYPYYISPTSVVRSGGVAVLEDRSNYVTIFTAQTTLSAMAYATEMTFGNYRDFDLWVCFDSVPNPLNLSAMRMANFRREVFATTVGGHLYLRRQLTDDNMFATWNEVDLPETGSHIDDVSNFVLTDQTDRLYVVDRGKVFGREKTSADPYSDYAPWVAYGSVDATRVTGGKLLYGPEQLFVVTVHGLLKTLPLEDRRQEKAADQWQTLETPEPLVDIDCTYAAANMFELYAVGKSGALYRRLHLNDDRWAEWIVQKPANVPPHLVQVAVSRVLETGPEVYGLNGDGFVMAQIEKNFWKLVPDSPKAP